jgi:DNA repair exonuclease SbcCD nuclease subunit
MPLSILHFSDLQLDASFADSRLPPEIGRWCREKLRQALQEILRLAQSRRADAVTIAGDLFDNERVQPETLQFLSEQFARVAPTPIFIAPGLHDHAGADSAYRVRQWPANVHIFLNETLSERALSSEYELWGAGRQRAQDEANVLEGTVVSTSGRIPLLLLHGRVAASELPPDGRPATQDSRGGLTVDGIAHSGFAAALLGRLLHRFTIANEKCLIVNPGSSQPMRFDEAHEHGAAWVVFAPGRETTVEWLPLKGLDFRTIDISVEEAHDSEMLLAAITQALQYQSLRDSIVRVRLVGTAKLAADFDMHALATRVRHHCAYLRLENLAPTALDFSRLSQELTVRGAFVREMLAQRAGEETMQKLHQDALIYGLQSFEQENIVLR